MPTEYYTTHRKKKDVIEYCPKCKKKGLIRRYVKVDVYTHSKTYKPVGSPFVDSELFRHVQSEERCNVPTPEKEAYWNWIAAEIADVIPNIHKAGWHANLSKKIIDAYHNNQPKDDLVLDIIGAFKRRLQKQIAGKQEIVNRICNIENRIQEDKSFS